MVDANLDQFYSDIPLETVAQIIKLNEPRCLQLRVQLVGITPAIWRQVLVPESITLVKLHKVLQVAMGWLDLHLHEFDINGVRYGTPDPTWDSGPDTVIAEKGVVLKQCLGGVSSFQYLYDFGDDWLHRIDIEKVMPLDPAISVPRCLAGAGACPPEDVGGLPGYQLLLDALSKPDDPEFQEMLGWVGAVGFDPKAFDLDVTNQALLKL